MNHGPATPSDAPRRPAEAAEPRATPDPATARPAVRRASPRRNFAANVTGYVATNLAAFVINVLLIKFIGPGVHGQYVLVFSVTMLCVWVATSGLAGTLGIQRIAVASSRSVEETAHHINGIAGTAILIALALGAAMAFGAEPIADLMGEPIADLVRLACIWPLAIVLLQVANMIGTGLESMAYNGVTMTLFHAVRVLWLVAALAVGSNIVAIFIGWSVLMPAAGIACLLIMRPLVRQMGVRVQPAFMGVRAVASLVGQSLPFLIASASFQLMPSALNMMIGGRLSESADVSYFQSSYSLSLIIVLFAMPAAQTIQPTIGRLRASTDPADRAAASRLAYRTVTRIAMLSLAIVTLTAVFGQWLLTVAYRSDYAAYAPLFVALAVAAAMTSMRTLLNSVLFAVDRQHAVAGLELARYVTVFGVGWWLLPREGLIALAWVMIAADGLSVVSRSLMVGRALTLRLLVPTLVWMAMVGAVWAAYRLVAPWSALVAGMLGVSLVHQLDRRARAA